jgi:hypothetical protein
MRAVDLVTMLAVAIAVATPASAQDDLFPPLRLGMSLDEARAAVADLAPTERSGLGGQLVTITAADAASVGGLAFAVEMTAGGRGVRSLDYYAAAPAANAAQCQELGLAVVSALEPRVGAFYWDITPADGEQTLETDAGSVVMVSAWTDRFRPLDPSRFYGEEAANYGLRTRADVDAPAGPALLRILADLEDGVCSIQLWYELDPVLRE